MKTVTPIYTVDAFTQEPFRGNPAGVCLIDKMMDDTWMQNVAKEMNLSETAFLMKEENKYLIRFFTPEAEIPLCGHATLASAHILFEEGLAENVEKLKLVSKAGELIAYKNDGWITLDFPAYGVKKIDPPAETVKLLAISPSELYLSDHGWVLALFRNEKEILSLNPDFKAMKHTMFGHTIATAPTVDSDYDFCVRCFVPALGIDEDPVTGSAHCALTPFWHERTGKISMVSKQVSAREGILKLYYKGSRVDISGQARTIIRGELLV